MARMGVAAALAVLVLGGCGERVYDVGLTGAIMGENLETTPNSPVRRMSGAKTDYPNLATVPARPTDVPTEQARQADMDALAKTRDTNKAAGQALKQDPRLPEPAAVPPKPDLRPGVSP